MVEDALQEVLSRIEDAASRIGRDPSDITLVAVTKTKPIEMMREYARVASDRGLAVVFGENYLQEIKEKRPQLPPGCELHMIGPLQSNKVRDAVQLVDVIESVHSLKVVEIIRREARRAGKCQRIYLQVNISGDQNKSGFGPDEIDHVVDQLSDNSESLALEGLMAITALYDEPEETRRDFRKLRMLRDQSAKRIKRPLRLSMGMSADFVIAIEEGADVIRVGSSLFGERS